MFQLPVPVITLRNSRKWNAEIWVSFLTRIRIRSHMTSPYRNTEGWPWSLTIFFLLMTKEHRRWVFKKTNSDVRMLSTRYGYSLFFWGPHFLTTWRKPNIPGCNWGWTRTCNFRKRRQMHEGTWAPRKHMRSQGRDSNFPIADLTVRRSRWSRGFAVVHIRELLQERRNSIASHTGSVSSCPPNPTMIQISASDIPSDQLP